MPFSIYSADRKLLLAAGRIVPNEFVRDSLLRTGVFSGGERAESSGRAAPVEGEQRDELDELQSDYQHTAERQQLGFRMERESVAYRTRVVGVSEDGTGLIMSAPLTMEGKPAQLVEGESWTFRALYLNAELDRLSHVLAMAAH
jgi:hypothetical protein